MSNSTYHPSGAVITRALITSFSGANTDITPVIAGFEIEQSMDMVGYLGYLTIGEGVGVLENFKLRGEEKLDLEIVSRDLNTKVELKAQIYKIDNVTTGNSNDKLFYRIHFLSRVNYEASKKRIIMPFQNVTAGYAAEQLFRKFFSELSPLSTRTTLPYNTKAFSINDDSKRAFYVQPTAGDIKVIIPNYSPTEAIYFMSLKSYSTDSSSSSFKFFETYSGFYFVTDEFLIKRAIDNPSEIIDLVYLPVSTLDPRAAALHVKLIESFSNDSRVDTALDLAVGGYRNKCIEIDLIRRNVVEKSFSYLDNLKYTGMDGQKVNISDDVHTPEFIKQTFNDNNAKRFLIFRDYSQTGDNPTTLRADQYYSEIASNRMFHEHHMNTTSVSVKLKGRLDIEPGRVVNIDATEFNVGTRSKQDNNQLSGRYLVRGVTHILDGNTLHTNLKLVKYNWSK